ncbi:gibberellin 20 oxidase 2-like [Canna indica]|uniref:Gibberellin 20 oxidase 2-like n=1 Tax=Canna indica TaxID=4628 RepID=A0AAQ3KP98_9LILI|nr:gibberellin 20 oxidase 2-like [Canna indica]
MEYSSPTSLLLSPATLDLNIKTKTHCSNTSSTIAGFNPSLLWEQPKIPQAFVWPHSDRSQDQLQELQVPVVDLEGFFDGEDASVAATAEAVRAACTTYGFFYVINHRVDADVSVNALRTAEELFKLPLSTKLRARRRPGSAFGYVGAHADRFASKLPWKETFSFGYDYGVNDGVVEYFTSKLGEEYKSMGRVFEGYCEEMKALSMAIEELLGVSLGLGREEYREYFQDGSCIVRCNNYPACQEPEMTLGTGPHCDPTAITILHQDQVGGLQVFADGKWQAVRPVPDALVVNIGDTFMALSNGRYKSCLHRAVVNRERERRSLAFFVCPRGDKVVRPPRALLVGGDGGGDVPRAFPDFTWMELLEFTQTQYRADASTLESFARRRLLSSST